MMLAVFVTLAAILLTSALRRDRPVGPRARVILEPVRILCGDCCPADGPLVITELSERGRCGTCGGRAYVPLASLAGRRWVPPVERGALRLADEADRERRREAKRDEVRKALRRA